MITSMITTLAVDTWVRMLDTGSCIFPNAAKFWQKIYALLKISLLPENSVQTGGFSPKFSTLGKIFRKENFLTG